MATSEAARTVREARLQIRSLEESTRLVHEAPASALAWLGALYLRRARLALRQAERAFALADDPRLDTLSPLKPQLRRPRAITGERRKRYRCSLCLEEMLLWTSQMEYVTHAHNRRCLGEFELVARLPKGRG